MHRQLDMKCFFGGLLLAFAVGGMLSSRLSWLVGWLDAVRKLLLGWLACHCLLHCLRTVDAWARLLRWG